MKIKKVSPTTPTTAQVVDSHSDSTTDSYSCHYINGIVESGSNANGNYIKYADGTMICTIIKTLTLTVSTQWGSLYEDNSTATQFDYPVQFVGNQPSVTATITGGNSGFVMTWIETNTPLVNTDRLAVVRGSSAGSQDYTINITAIGRWK